jgi:hypothetical protein
MNIIGINSESIFGVSPDPVGKRLASGWSSAATTQNSTFTTSKFLLDEFICLPFEREVAVSLPSPNWSVDQSVGSVINPPIRILRAAGCFGARVSLLGAPLPEAKHERSYP